MTEIRYSHETPAARSTVLTLGPHALRAYRGAAPPDPEAARIIRPTHEIGKITAHKATAGTSRGSYKTEPNGCDHSKYKAWAHGYGRVKCAGCKRTYIPVSLQ